MSKAYCVNTITTEEFVWDDEHKFQDRTYWEARPTLLLIPASSWAEIKTFIIQICKRSNKCDQEVAGWDRTVEAIDQQLEQKQ